MAKTLVYYSIYSAALVNIMSVASLPVPPLPAHRADNALGNKSIQPFVGRCVVAHQPVRSASMSINHVSRDQTSRKVAERIRGGCDCCASLTMSIIVMCCMPCR
ncbi:hypothetical protein RSAG8_02265, partial [Rhizoctonia solani AG-8 WAC10335]